MKIKDGELSIKGFLIGITRSLIIALICFSFNRGYTAVNELSANVAELNINMKNLIKLSDKNSIDIEKNKEDITNLKVRVSVVESKIK